MQIFTARYGISYDLYFTMVVAGETNLAVTGDWTPATGDTKISKDGGTVANTTNNPAIVAGTGSVIWKLTLTATEMEADQIQVQIVDSATKAVEDNAFSITTEMTGHMEAMQAIFVGEVDTATFTSTTTEFEALKLWPDVTEPTTADRLNNRRLIFTSGAMLGEGVNIDDYVLANSKFKFTVPVMASTPADGVRFVIL